MHMNKPRLAVLGLGDGVLREIETILCTWAGRSGHRRIQVPVSIAWLHEPAGMHNYLILDLA